MSQSSASNGFSRRTLLKATAAAAAVTATGLRAPFVHAQQRSLKVGTYGGYFEESFSEHVYPGFTEATGIEVESIPEPTGEAWLVQLQAAARAGQAPADVSMMAQVPMLRGITADLWQPLDMERMPNARETIAEFRNTWPDGRVAGVPAVTWYITLVTNTDVYPQPPESWADMWAPGNERRLGLLALASNSFLLEITAETFFGGQDLLATDEGVERVLAKLAELKPNVALWYRDEGQFQQALQSGEIPMGQYYHDVTGLAAADGFPVRSTFPKEGGVVDRGSWAVVRSSDRLEEAQVFIDYVSQPEIQALLARKVGTAPTIPRELLDLTDEEFAAVSSTGRPIIPNYALYTERGDRIADRWTAMITG
ncbi:ABC transporter substrate-binding protein [Arenibaculum sp.]|uniref:ABC transporter substrate-binding protein n=1 Tax=Arenibaculum sp. TaxID=2865862 RepID=UPI002E15C732|nr:ABC transporter substrate-binding protein [Arenibaculum sp.]